MEGKTGEPGEDLGTNNKLKTFMTQAPATRVKGKCSHRYTILLSLYVIST